MKPRHLPYPPHPPVTAVENVCKDVILTFTPKTESKPAFLKGNEGDKTSLKRVGKKDIIWSSYCIFTYVYQCRRHLHLE